MRNRMKDFKMNYEKGFTLIELLIVIVIIGILASFLMANYVGVRSRARDVQRKADLRQLQSAFELYRSEDASGQYPAALPACGAALKNALNTIIYMTKAPCDPLAPTTQKYNYLPAGSNSTYTLWACLENVNDQQADGSSACAAGTKSNTLSNP
jgi:general secretion pathway protein G